MFDRVSSAKVALRWPRKICCQILSRVSVEIDFTNLILILMKLIVHPKKFQIVNQPKINSTFEPVLGLRGMGLC